MLSKVNILCLYYEIEWKIMNIINVTFENKNYLPRNLSRELMRYIDDFIHELSDDNNSKNHEDFLISY